MNSISQSTKSADNKASGKRLMFQLDGLLTVDDLAALLKIKVRTVREWVARRKLPFTRLNRRVYFDVGVVEEILRRNAIPAASPTPKPAGQGGERKDRGDQNE